MVKEQCGLSSDVGGSLKQKYATWMFNRIDTGDASKIINDKNVGFQDPVGIFLFSLDQKGNL